MAEIVKTCKKHGELDATQVYHVKQGKYARVVCKKCKNATTMAWAKRNPDKVAAIAQKHAPKAVLRRMRAKYYRNAARNLSDGYIRNLLRNVYKVKSCEIPEAAIVIKREAMIAKRAFLDDAQYIWQLDQIFGRGENLYEEI